LQPTYLRREPQNISQFLAFVWQELLTILLLPSVMPDKVRCAHILVKTQTEAKTVQDRLAKGEAFAAIAKQVSICPSGKKGGNLGKFGRGQMVREFETSAFKLQKGQVSAPVKTKFGYHIIKRIE
jgi:peptidyl-prolyl cis-trans isomerase C